ncbi:transporter substrate-binding domain-containing protein [Glaciimonas immobilis]|uniref:Polar amino acid transport system substrate-binding protein n=1 Tax=Glaciimonas immobilis TaxID=728004 RepID=A0A840RQ06_9BURK|nr:transporter substrate-binding domain-containing protein [Glaciimonas immobilis]KAF3996991.1 transporter substrate-binding domain-containing protein [Glaciimonas immobilis]MBB5199825.1 polar amino acid transport system substrate-binding protein [Glaciimonas immobilis]
MHHRRLFIGLLVAVSCALPMLANAQSADVIRVVTDSTFPPFEFFKDGKRTGFDIELMETLGKIMGKKIEWTDIDFKGLIPGLISKRFDAAASAIYITDERRKVVDLTDPYYPGGLVMVVKSSDASIQKADDMKGKKVAVQVGTKSVNYLKDYYPQIQRVEVEKNQEMFNLVEIGRADAAVTGKPAALEYVKVRPTLKVIAKPVSVELYGFAVRKDMPELTLALNAALQKSKLDGSYDKLVKKWLDSSAR